VVDCDTCHDGLGFVTQAHYDRANARTGSNALRVPPGDLAFPPSFPYAAQNGTVGFDNTLTPVAVLSCSAIKCHGGATPTPNWQTGTIVTTVNAGCRTCHKAANTGSPQFNDVTNNVHPTHITHAFGRNIDCTTCHDPVQLTPLRHFGSLIDNVIAAGAARATIQASLAYNPPGAVSINSCNTGCH
jgi:predicted CxxxxCH...CXXCH cytochrome family protein